MFCPGARRFLHSLVLELKRLQALLLSSSGVFQGVEAFSLVKHLQLQRILGSLESESIIIIIVWHTVRKFLLSVLPPSLTCCGRPLSLSLCCQRPFWWCFDPPGEGRTTNKIIGSCLLLQWQETKWRRTVLVSASFWYSLLLLCLSWRMVSEFLLMAHSDFSYCAALSPPSGYNSTVTEIFVDKTLFAFS